jgi:hypothetical protein
LIESLMRSLVRFQVPGRVLKTVLSAALLLALRAAPAQAPAPLPSLHAAEARYPLPQHQTLNYIVDWRVFPAGTATIHLDADGNTERISASGVDIGAVSLLFKVNDRFQSALDRRSGCSQYFNKELQEGHRQITSSLTFNYKAGEQLLEEKNLVKNNSKILKAGIPGCVSDLMSAVFYGSTQELNVGQRFSFPLADSMRTVAVIMKVEARERVVTPSGTYDTIRVQPTADAGIVKNRGKIWIWYTDDARHTPVQMRARLFWGTITLRLSSLEQK